MPAVWDEGEDRYSVRQILLKVGWSFVAVAGVVFVWLGVELLLHSGGFRGESEVSQMPILMPMSATVYCPELNETLLARPATFGPVIPRRSYGEDGEPVEGYAGPIKVVRSLGCNIDDDYEDLRGRIAVVRRGGCGFYEKVLVLQDWGAKAVIVGDDRPHKGLVTMFTKEDVDLSRIPAVFVSYDSYETLSMVSTVVMATTSDSSPIADTLIFLLVSPLCSLSIIYGMLLFHRRYKILKERAPKSLVDRLPTRIWNGNHVISQGKGGAAGDSKVWASSGECIICLEDFIIGVSRVMRLPCDHEFHADCISRWLVSRKKTCPICKQDVTKISETSPLIKRRQPRRSGG
ncbi:hypothetical protein TRICI_004271 [Trichomonascus ciferrii]|uniref:RING-type domain-containing protein n=1 Tax=Trichomonascus ciferrii TaxID=44093 RepID=A0A642V1J4_9ASCO|nr:hypothetical protein TRICI_004271 [Trichomonascus ciferrii]